MTAARRPAPQRARRQQEEAVLRKKVMLALGMRDDVTVWEHPTGSAQAPSGAWVTYGLAGSPDIIGFVDGGLFFGLELKTPTGTHEKQQRIFKRNAERRGATYFLARSVDEAHAAVDAAVARARELGLKPSAPLDLFATRTEARP